MNDTKIIDVCAVPGCGSRLLWNEELWEKPIWENALCILITGHEKGGLDRRKNETDKD